MSTQDSSWKEELTKKYYFSGDPQGLVTFIEQLIQSEMDRTRIITESDVFRVRNESGTWSHFSLKRLARDVKVQKVVEQSESVELLSTINSK